MDRQVLENVALLQSSPSGGGITRRDLTVAQRRARLALVVVLAGLALWTLRAFLPALAWAAILAIATWPLYRRAETRWPPGKHNLLLPGLFTLAVALCVLVPLALAGYQFGREALVVFRLAEEARQHGLPEPSWLAQLPFGAAQATAWWHDNLADPAGYADLLHRLQHGSAMSYSRRLGEQLLRRSVVFGFTLLALFVLYREADRVRAQLLAVSGRAFGPHGERIGRQVVASIHGTVDGLVLVGLGVGLLLGILYWVLGVPHPTLFGGATAIAAMIPFGAPIVFCVAALLVGAQGQIGAAAAIVAIGFAVIFVADHFVRPALIGGATKLPFLWVLLGILGGVETWGLLGLFLGPALMAALMLVWRDYVDGAGRAGSVLTESGFGGVESRASRSRLERASMDDATLL